MSRFSELSLAKADAMPRVLAQAIAMVPKIDRFFGCYLSSVKFVERKGFGSVMATDCAGVIYYDPDMLNDPASPWFNVPLVACIIVHELCHIWRMDGFFVQEDNRDPQLANVALDAVINRDMLASGYLFPGISAIGGFASPESHMKGRTGAIASFDPGDTAVSIYERIKDMQKDTRGQRGQGDIDMEAFGKAVAAAGGADAFKAAIAKRIAKADAMANAQQEAYGDKPGEECEAIGGHGTHTALSDQVLAWYGLKARPVKNPLRNVVGSAVRATYKAGGKRGRTMMIPSVMSDIVGYIIPGRRRVPSVKPAVAFDISGSISKDMLLRFGQEAHSFGGTLSDRGHQTQACFFNSRVVQSNTLAHYRKSENIPYPCGGTDFNPIFTDWLPKLKVKPSHLLIWTDCFGAMPSKAPAGITIIFIVPKEYDTPEFRDCQYGRAARAIGKIVYSN